MVHRAKPDPADAYPLAALTLVAGTETIPLKPQMGTLKPYYQSVCENVGDLQIGFPLVKDEVAKITSATVKWCRSSYGTTTPASSSRTPASSTNANGHNRRRKLGEHDERMLHARATPPNVRTNGRSMHE